MPFYRCSGGGKLNISQKFNVQLNNVSTSKITAKEFLGKDIALKGVIIGVPQKDAYNFGGVSIHTKDEAVSNLIYYALQSVVYSDSSAAFAAGCTGNPSGGMDTDRGGFYTGGYGSHPKWKIENGVYTADRLTGAVNNNTVLTCYVNFIY